VPAEPAGFDDRVLAALFERRIVLVRGHLDDGRAGEVAAALMTLDALGDDAIELSLQAPSGTFDAALIVLDAIDVCGVAVNTSALGVVGGGAVAILAAGDRRVMSPHARLHLREPDLSWTARAGDIDEGARHWAQRRAQFFEALADRLHRGADDVESQWQRATFLDAQEAVAAGYADAVAGPEDR
jgi:ATP-dependent Clp protease protease subunit